MLGYLPFTAFMSKCKDNIFNHHVPPPLSLSVHIQYHKLLHGSHATAAIMTPSVAVVQMVTGVTGMHKCHVLHFPSTATVISAHWHMNDVNHNNMQYATCVVCTLWSFYHSWAPLCTECLEHTGQCDLVSWLLRNTLPHLTAPCTSESKYNIFHLFFNKESLWRACAWTFHSVCVFLEGRGRYIPIHMF